MTTMDMQHELDTLSAMRVEHTQLPAQKLAAILQQLDPETAERVQAIVRELGFQEQSPDFLRLAEYHSTCSGR
jgi:hypothetical protein